VGTGRFTAGTIALLAITLAATTSGWVPIVAVVAAVGAVSSLAVGRMSVPQVEVNHRFGAASSVRSIAQGPMLRKVAMAQLLFGGGMVAAPALIAMVHVDRLGLGFDDIALAGLLSYGSTAATIGLWGRLASRSGAFVSIAAGTTLGAVSLVAFALAPDFAAVVVATLLLGVANAAVNASWPLLLAEHASLDDQEAVAAGMNAVMGLRGFVTPFLVMAPVQAGLIDETGGLLLCMVASASGAILYARLAGYRVPARLKGAASAIAQWRPASSLIPASSTSGWPVIRRSRLMRSAIAGWVLKRPRALLSSFLTGLTT
jgi:predicted MFS family arabinose efflux permease